MSADLASLFLLLPSLDTGTALWMGAGCVLPRSVSWPELLPQSGPKWDCWTGAEQGDAYAAFEGCTSIHLWL